MYMYMYIYISVHVHIQILQGVGNSQLVYTPARETTLLHRRAHNADGGSENPTAAGQHDIKPQEAAVRAQPGDASGSAVRS